MSSVPDMTLSRNSEFMFTISFRHRSCSMAVKSACDLLWTEVNTNSSWGRISLSHYVIKLWKFFKVTNTAEHSISIDGLEELIWLSIRESILASVSVASQECNEQKSEEAVCASSVSHWAVTELRVYCVVRSIVILIFEVFLLRI